MAKRQNVSGLNIIDVHSKVGGESTRPNYMQDAMKVFDLIKEKKKQAVEYNNELKDTQRSSFQTAADAINKRLSTYDKGGREAGLHTSVYDTTYDYIEQLKVEFEKYNTVGSADNPENKKKRMEIMGMLQQIQQSSLTFRTDLLTIGKLFGEELDLTQFHKGIPQLDLAIGEQILNMDGDYSNVQTIWNADTNSMAIQVTITEKMYEGMTSEDKKKYKPDQVISLNARDLTSKFPGKGNVDKMITTIDAFHATNKTSANKAKLGDEFKNEIYIEDIKKTIGGDKMSATHIFQSTDSHTNWNDWSTEIDDGFSGNYDKGSWAHALEISEMKDEEGNSIFHYDNRDKEGFGWKAVDNLIQSGVISEAELLKLAKKNPGPRVISDFKVDGILSEDEYILIMESDLKSQVIDALVNPQNDAYDHKLSVEEYSKWRSSSAQMDWDNEQKIKQDKENEKNRRTFKTPTVKTLDPNKNRPFKLQTGENIFSTENTTPRELKLKQNQLTKLKTDVDKVTGSGVLSVDVKDKAASKSVKVFGYNVSYFPGKGYAEVDNNNKPIVEKYYETVGNYFDSRNIPIDYVDMDIQGVSSAAAFNK